MIEFELGLLIMVGLVLAFSIGIYIGKSLR